MERDILLRLALIITLSTFAATAASFDSYGIHGLVAGPIHGAITAEACKRFGIADCKRLQESVRFPDWEQTSLNRFKLLPNSSYQPSNHFDRPTIKTNEQAFREAAYFVRTEREKCLTFARSGNHGEAVASLGKVLHAIQDFVSHSNVIDMSVEDRDEAVNAIWDESKSIPSRLMLTGYDANSRIPGEPTGDSYSHDSYSKDNPKKNKESRTLVNGISKHEIAFTIAVNISEKALAKLKVDLGPTWEPFVRQCV